MEVLLGVIISLIVQSLKKTFGMEGGKVIAYCVILSLFGAGAYVGLVEVGYWDTVREVLITAGAFYAFVVKSVERYLDNNPPFLSR